MLKQNRPVKAESVRNYRKKAGLPPGSLVYTGNRNEETSFSLLSYNAESAEKTDSRDVGEIISRLQPGSNHWIDVTGLTDTGLIEKLGSHHLLHPLLLEDVLNTESVIKIENFGDVLYLCLKMLKWNEEQRSIETEQISIVVGENYLLSFKEAGSNIFDAVSERIENGLSKAREKSIDFLAYVLTDKIVDNYFLVLEKIEDHIEATELELIRDTDRISPVELMHLKKQLILLRKYVYPLRDEVRKLQHDDSRLIDRKTIKYINDLYDHLQSITQNIEGFRDTISNLMELYSANISNRLNSVMKTLTIVGAIFIPLTFIAGIYGMNFDHMPELHYRWAYPAVMALMFVIAIGMYFYMKSRRWF